MSTGRQSRRARPVCYATVPSACPKRAYASPQTAHKVAAATNKRTLNDDPARPYRCPDCGRWHIGHPSLDL